MATQKKIGNMSTYSYRQIPTTIVDQNNDYPLAKAMTIRLQGATNKLKYYMADRTIASLSDTQKNNYLEIPDDSIPTWINRTINFTGNDNTSQPCNITNITQSNPGNNILNAYYYSTSTESGLKTGIAIGLNIQPCNEESVYYTRVKQYLFNNSSLTDRSVNVYVPQDNTGTPTDPDTFYYNTIEKVKGALASGDFYYIAGSTFVNWDGSVATTPSPADATAYRNAALWFECDMNVPSVTSDAYDGNVERLQGAIIANKIFRWFDFRTAVLGDLFNPGLLKGVIKPEEFLGWRGGNEYGAIIKKEALIRFMNITGIPFLIKEGAISLSDFTPDYSEWGGYDPNYEYEDPDGPPRGQPTDVTGGGDGNGDNTSDEYEQSDGYNPLYPTAKQWVMNATEVDVLQSYLWFPSVWQQIQELWGDAWGAIISLKYYPFNILGHDARGVGEKEEIVIGNVALVSVNPSLPQGAQPPDATGSPLSKNYNCRIDIGEYEFKEYFGSFMDYEPYTSISIFLPFIGWRDIGTSEVMGKKLKVHYIVDFNTGGCTAYLTIDDGTNEFLYNSYQGTIGIDLPLQQSDYMDKVRNMGITLLSSAVGAMVQANGVQAPNAVSSGEEIKSEYKPSIKNVLRSKHSNLKFEPIDTGSDDVIKTDPTLSIVNSLSHVAKMGVSPVHTTTSGNLGPTDSLWISRKPIIRIERPIKSEASSFEENQGRPANITKKLADMTGYVECLNPVINFKCNESERAEIATLLQGGIYL